MVYSPYFDPTFFKMLKLRKVCTLDASTQGARTGYSCSIGALIGAALAGGVTSEIGGLGAGIVIATFCSGAGVAVERTTRSTQIKAGCDR